MTLSFSHTRLLPIGMTAKIRVTGLSSSHDDITVSIVSLTDVNGVWWQLSYAYDYDENEWTNRLDTITNKFNPVSLFTDLRAFYEHKTIESLLREVRTTWQDTIDQANGVSDAG